MISLARPIYEWLRSVQPSEISPDASANTPADAAATDEAATDDTEINGAEMKGPEKETPAKSEDAAADAPVDALKDTSAAETE